MIELKNLSVSYGKRPVLKELSVVFARGRVTSVIGQNGCGKSTLLRSVVGMLSPVGGVIEIDGVPADSLSRNERAKKIAYLSQTRSVPDITVEQLVLHGRYPHLSYPRRYTRHDMEIAHGAMEQMGISELSGSPLARLSGGVRQKAYIAMALAQDTDYILLDEPATYLDISNQLELMRILRGLADGGKGIVTVTHDLPMAFRFSDAVSVLHQGRFVACDAPEALYDSSVLKEIFGVSLSRSQSSSQYGYDF